MTDSPFHWGRAQHFLATLALPLALLLGAAWMHVRLGGMAPSMAQLLALTPYGLALAGALVGWRFNSSRTVFLMGMLALGHGLLQGPLAGGPFGSPINGIIFTAFALLLPLNTLYFALTPERGLATGGGLARLGVLSAQVAAVAAVIYAAPAGIEPSAIQDFQQGIWSLLRTRIFPPEMDRWTALPQPALIAFTVSIGVILVQGLIKDRPVDLAMAGALAALWAALHGIGNGAVPALWFTAAAVIALAGVLQDSYRMAFLDDLTGLPGRRALNAECAKLGRRYAIAMLDVDHFKKFNDTYGHDVGDQVLRMVAARMMRVSGGGKVFRYGGEEFTVLFPGKEAEEALPHLDALREDIAQSGFLLRDDQRPKEKPKSPRQQSPEPHRVSVTVSMGVADHLAAEGPDQVILLADQALYGAKEAGRNRVMAFAA
ncbi:GGDEF domain-containing protein [Magnetospira thiophila]